MDRKRLQSQMRHGRPINDTSTSVKKDVIWVEKNTTPPQDVHTQTQRVVPGQFSSTYTETEELN